MPRGVAVIMTAGILTMIASVVLILAIFTWQPWRESTTGGGIQGGADTPVPEHQRTLPATR
jgi:hypothetical protein